ncbi:hypothetical protein WHR41_06556 [Cladosporium halotolerans]|uniref:Zn(2)-C6 fungal-type domain-containing protein n=1 Tax=Cladosporium halotolerans TaxID=1052096 RepID=A0AB34KJ46_9PEZI
MTHWSVLPFPLCFLAASVQYSIPNTDLYIRHLQTYLDCHALAGSGTKMSTPASVEWNKPSLSSTSSSSSVEAIRKRVRKACDRCRLKKGKCDGAYPCSRCKVDNVVCFFSEGKRMSNRSHPKGYAEMLERQQAQLVAAIQEMYSRMRKASAWEGQPLDHHGSPPLTHDILAALDLLEPKNDGSGEMESFEDLQDAPHSDSAYDSSPQRKRRRSASDSEQSRSTSPASQQKAGTSQSFSSSMTKGSSRDPITSSPPQLLPKPAQPDQRPLRPLAAQQAPSQPSPPPALTIPTEPPALQPLSSDTTSTTLPSPTAIPPLFSDPQLFSPDWTQLLSDKSIGQGLDLTSYDPAPLFVQPTALTQEPSPTQGKTTPGREPRIWKRRLTSGIGFDRSDFMTDYASLSGLDLTAVQPWKAMGNQDAVVS